MTILIHVSLNEHRTIFMQNNIGKSGWLNVGQVLLSYRNVIVTVWRNNIGPAFYPNAQPMAMEMIKIQCRANMCVLPRICIVD